jgi:F-type H+/Na+-transporting ATPase subunit alpha
MKTDTIIQQLKDRIAGFDPKADVSHVGTVTEVGDGIARISGLSEVRSMEMLDFGNDLFGVALNLEERSVGAIILGDFNKIKQGDIVKATGRILSVPVGEQLIGRVVDALGQAKDGKSEINSDKTYPVEKIAPGVITRQSVHQPVQTGIKAVDALIPIGRGQRELIIGDRQTGKVKT